MTDVNQPQNQPTKGGCQIRFSLGSLFLLTTCIAVIIASVHHRGPDGVLFASFCFYLALPSLFSIFVQVSLIEHDDIASKQVFGFFATMFTLAFVLFGAVGDEGTFAACMGPIFFWPPQLFAIVFAISRWGKQQSNPID